MRLKRQPALSVLIPEKSSRLANRFQGTSFMFNEKARGVLIESTRFGLLFELSKFNLISLSIDHALWVFYVLYFKAFCVKLDPENKN